MRLFRKRPDTHVRTSGASARSQSSARGKIASQEPRTRVSPDHSQYIPENQVIELLWMGNVEGDWRPFVFALRSGYIRTDSTRRAQDGSVRPSLLSMIVIKAPLTVIKEAVSAGAGVDPDHLIGAAASGDPIKLRYLLSLGVRPLEMSAPPEQLILMAANRGSLRMLEQVWGIGIRWDIERARNQLRIFDSAARCNKAIEILDFLLERGIGPSDQALTEGLPSETLTKEVCFLLLDMGWAVPPEREAKLRAGMHQPCRKRVLH